MGEWVMCGGPILFLTPHRRETSVMKEGGSEEKHP